VIDRLAALRGVDAADHLLDRAEAELRHELAHFHRDEAHEVDDVLGLARELLAQRGSCVAMPAGRCSSDTRAS
jgi:hypothetical protein